MDAIWGPALDAEVAYRQERVRDATRPRVRRADRTAVRASDRQRRTDGVADRAADPVPGRPLAPAASSRGPRAHRDEWEGRRGWVLRGSGAWPEAR
ncbi:hypothetical protein AGMMS50218_03000 [Actinomycetota bacterium]|nr:hypothetical protein AGMMS50218_03000 [Actinomycetota bacterium]